MQTEEINLLTLLHQKVLTSCHISVSMFNSQSCRPNKATVLWSFSCQGGPPCKV